MTASVADKPQLDYAPTLPWRRTRLARLLFALLLLVVVVGAGILAYPRVREQLQVLEWQRRCMAAPVPPGTLVLEDRDWLFPSGTGSAGVPFVWRSLYGAISPPGLNSASTLFLQDMRTPAGRRRLVAVDIDRPPMWRPWREPYVLNLSARVVRPGVGMLRPTVVSTTSHSVTVANSPLQEREPGRHLRVYAGTRDPKDASHFTFTYEAGGEAHVVDGWLRDDDTVVLETRTESTPTPPAPASPASPRTSAGSARRPSPRPAAQ